MLRPHRAMTCHWIELAEVRLVDKEQSEQDNCGKRYQLCVSRDLRESAGRLDAAEVDEDYRPDGAEREYRRHSAIVQARK